MAELTFLGAADRVTGSCYLLRTESATILLECGLIQGSYKDEEHNRDPFPFDIEGVDAVVVSHAHLDHSGRLPKLVSDGYRGPVYLTLASSEIVEVILKDAAHLAARDAEWENRRRRRAGKPDIAPLYTPDDVEATLDRFEGVKYGERVAIAPDVDVRFHDAGHILGSAIVELIVREGGGEKTLVFSGDLGNSDAALLRDPAVLHKADLLLLESTYGDRDHQPMERTLEEFESALVEAERNGGNVLIPAFAIGRTQEIIFRLGELYQAGRLPQQAVFLDSPMAIAATEIYHRFQNVFNSEDTGEMRRASAPSLHRFLPILRYSHTPEDSMALNRIRHGAIIIAGSGMCSGGRILHHLKHNLWRRGTDVIIVGYQAIGTLGRALVDGAKHVRIFGEEIAVAANIQTLGGFSAHAGQSQLLRWAGQFREPRPRLCLVHGEPEKMRVLQKAFAQRLDWQAEMHGVGDRVRL
jgi:metallo-beta-lactamase family protein